MRRRPFGTGSTHLVSAALAIALSGCGGGGSGDSGSGTSTQTITLSGSVGDGPIVGATLTVRNASGSVVATATSDAEAEYQLSLPATVTFPITITAAGGTDTVTSAPPSFAMTSAVLIARDGTANVNPFSSVIVRTAQAMPGGLTAQNLLNATSSVLAALNFGLDPQAVPDPIGTRVTAGNVAAVVKASEALAEMIRRTKDALATGGLSLSAEEILDALAADLTDGALDGVGAGANPRVAATAAIVSARITVESLLNRLQVDGSSATARLDAAIRLTAPDATQATSDVPANAALVSQAKTAVSAAQTLAPSTALSGLRIALDQIPSGSSPSQVAALLGSSPEQSLDEPLVQIMTATDTDIEAVNAVVRGTSSGSGSGSGGTPTAATITATTPANYVWSALQEGEPVYVDRNYTFTTVPAALQGYRYLQTANSDKGATGAGFVSFVSDSNLTVYVAHDPGASPRPAWLSGWTDTGEQLVTTDKTLQLFKKDFGAGTISLGGNEGDGGSSMYSVVIGTVADTDGDGMPDTWEAAHGLDSSDPADASADSDGDGIANLDEYRTGTDPNVPNQPDALPAANSDNAATPMDTPVSVAVLSNDSGLTDTPITVNLLDTPNHGSATVNPDNTITYTPNFEFAGTDILQYEVVDADGDVATASLAVSVTCSGCAAGVRLVYSWDPTPDPVAGYRVYYGASLSAASQLLSDISVGTPTFTARTPSVVYDAWNDLQLQKGDPICFRVKAYNSAGSSEFSTGTCGTIPN